MAYEIEYYNAKVLTQIEAWPVGIYANFVQLYALLEELGPELKMPYSKSMGEGLFELRPHGEEGIGRAFYCFLKAKRIVIVHAIIKKTQETPEKHLKLARKRVKEVRNA